MQCKHLLSTNTRCKRYVKKGFKYCHHHYRKIYDKPKNCPVCYSSLHQTTRSLSCGHWVHRSCIQKSQKAECPICRAELSDIEVDDCCMSTNSSEDLHDLLQELDTNTTINRIVITTDNLLFGLVSFLLYTRIINPYNSSLQLHHFISACINNSIPINHPSHEDIVRVIIHTLYE